MGLSYSSYATPRVDLGEAFLEYTIEDRNFVGKEIYPLLPLPRKEATFPKITRENLLRTGDTKRGAGGHYSRSQPAGEDQTYRCEEHGHEVVVDDSERELYANDFDYELEATKHAWMKLMLNHEVRVRDKVIDTTAFTVGNGRRTDVATPWSSPAADIIGDVLRGKESVRRRTGTEPTAMLVNKETLNNLIINTAIRNSLQYTQVATFDALEQALARLFKLQKIIIAGQVENTADEGQAATIADIWGTGWAVIAVVPMGGSLREPAVGRSVLWQADSPEAVMVEVYRDEAIRSDVVRGRHNIDELRIDPDFQQLLDIAG